MLRITSSAPQCNVPLQRGVVTGSKLQVLCPALQRSAAARCRNQNRSHFVSQFLFFFHFLANNLNVAVLPVALPEFDGPVADVLSVYLPHGANKIVRVFETDKAISAKIPNKAHSNLSDLSDTHATYPLLFLEFFSLTTLAF